MAMRIGDRAFLCEILDVLMTSIEEEETKAAAHQRAFDKLLDYLTQDVTSDLGPSPMGMMAQHRLNKAKQWRQERHTTSLLQERQRQSALKSSGA